MSAKHTRGPWQADWLYSSDIPENARVVIHAASRDDNHLHTKVAGACFSLRPTGYHVSDRDEAEANARLIAAAPTYYEAGVEFRAYEAELAAGDDVAAMNHYARASQLLADAHAKATGEQP